MTALIVEWNDARVDPSTHAQFHPPSVIWCAGNHAAIGETSAPSHVPLARVKALMQASTSPPQYGRSSYSQRALARRSPAVSGFNASGSTPHSRRELSDHVVAVHG